MQGYQALVLTFSFKLSVLTHEHFSQVTYTSSCFSEKPFIAVTITFSLETE